MTYNTYSELKTLMQGYLARYDTDLLARIPEFISLAELILARLPKHLSLKRVVVSTMTKNNPVLQKPNDWRSTVSFNYGTASKDKSIIARSSNLGTRTIYFETPHDFVVGDSVSVSGLADSNYNGTGLIITATAPLSVSYYQGVASEAKVTDTGYVTTSLDITNMLLPRGYEFCRDYWPDTTKTGKPTYYSNYQQNYYFMVPTPDQPYPFELVYYATPQALSESNQVNWFTQYTKDALLYGSLLQAAPYLKNDDRIQTWKDFYSAAINSIDAEAKENLDDGSMKRSQAQ
jgi:hypothetical protein